MFKLTVKTRSVSTPHGDNSPCEFNHTLVKLIVRAGAIFLPWGDRWITAGSSKSKPILLDAAYRQGGSKSRTRSEYRTRYVSLDKPVSWCWQTGRLTGMMSEKAEFTFMRCFLDRQGIGSIAHSKESN